MTGGDDRIITDPFSPPSSRHALPCVSPSFSLPLFLSLCLIFQPFTISSHPFPETLPLSFPHSVSSRFRALCSAFCSILPLRLFPQTFLFPQAGNLASFPFFPSSIIIRASASISSVPCVFEGTSLLREFVNALSYHYVRRAYWSGIQK